MKTIQKNRAWYWIRTVFGPDRERYEGVYKINIYLLRLLYFLIIVFVGRDSWTTILSHQGHWDYLQAVAFCVWAAYSTLSILGLINPLKMLPLVLFEILYKSIWLIIVAYPLWSRNQLAGSPAEELTYAFLWLPLPLLAVPWGYAFKTYFSFPRKMRSLTSHDPRIGGGEIIQTSGKY
ncbi:MAG TPA: hypothetical protein VIW68_00790 [Candidatus Sulfotelmatobacter sp.]